MKLKMMELPPLSSGQDDLSMVRFALNEIVMDICREVISANEDWMPFAIVFAEDRHVAVQTTELFRNNVDKITWLLNLKDLCKALKAYAVVQVIQGYYLEVDRLYDYDSNKSVKDQGGKESLIVTVELVGKRYYGTKACIDGNRVSDFDEVREFEEGPGRFNLSLLPSEEKKFVKP